MDTGPWSISPQLDDVLDEESDVEDGEHDLERLGAMLVGGMGVWATDDLGLGETSALGLVEGMVDSMVIAMVSLMG